MSDNAWAPRGGGHVDWLINQEENKPDRLVFHQLWGNFKSNDFEYEAGDKTMVKG